MWVSHLEREGFQVKTTDVPDMRLVTDYIAAEEAKTKPWWKFW